MATPKSEGELPSHMVPYPTGNPPDQSSINPELPEPPKTPPPEAPEPPVARKVNSEPENDKPKGKK